MKFKYSVGEKVLCFEPDQTKARVLYNAKIMDADIVKDSKGKKFVEYKIHFQGWNHAWDRWAEESFVLKDNDQNRKLQRKLAKKAIKKLRLQKGKRRHHLPGVSSKVEGEEIMKLDSSSDESFQSDITNSTKGKQSDVEDEDALEKRMKTPTSLQSEGGNPHPSVDLPVEDDASSTREDGQYRRAVNLDIPISLQRKLEEDNLLITNSNMLVNLPIQPNVVQILENYAKRFAINSITNADKHRFTTITPTGQTVDVDVLPPDKRISLCQEICSDLKLLFDYVLPLTLLYIPERAQFKKLVTTTKIARSRKQGTEDRMSMTKEGKTCPTSKKLDFDQCSPEGTEKAADDSGLNEAKQVGVEEMELHNRKRQRVTSLNELSENLLEPPVKKERSISESEHLEHSRPHHKKKSAEDLMIEETHKYLIPNQPKLDQTGLSKDSHGRRRSSRLSHHDCTPVPDYFEEDIYATQGAELEECTTQTSTRISSHNPTVTLKPYMFLRKALRQRNSVLSYDSVPSSSKQASNLSTKSSASNLSTLLDQEQFLSYAGSDIKKKVEMAKIWNWTILPRNYSPEEGTSVPPSLLYGFHHLMRLFVKLPDILMRMEIPEFKLKILIKHLNTLLKFLNEYEHELFQLEDYIPST